MVKKETIKGIGSRIKSMDLFGPRVQLRLNNKKEFKTTLGGTFTLILFIATSLVGFYYLLQLTARSTPSIQFKEKLLEQIDMEEVKEELLVHLIGVVNKESGQMLSNGFSVTLTISRTNKKVSIFELEKCQNNSSEFKDIQEHVLQKGNEYSNYYCLSQKDFQNANLLQLDPTSVINYQLQLEYSLLAEKGDNLEVINISKDSFLDPTQYENPFQPYFCINMISLNQYYFDIQFSSRMLFIEVRSSNGYFLKEISSISSIQLEDSQETQTNSILRFQRDMNQGHTIQMTYSFNQKKQIQVRSYIMLLDVLSIIGGFIKTQMVVYRFLLRPFSKMALYASLLNELFSFEDSQEEETKQRERRMTQLKKEETEENIKLTKILNQHLKDNRKGQVAGDPISKKEAENAFRKFMRIGQETLILTGIDYIRNLFGCWCKVKKGKLIKTSKHKFNERIDIIYILKKLVEIDKLKMILLSDHQRRVFDYLPKPLVGIEEEYKSTILKQESNMRTEWSLINTENSSLNKAILAVQAFQYIMKADTAPLSIIDLRLIEMLDPEIVKKFTSIQLETQSEENLICKGQTAHHSTIEIGDPQRFQSDNILEKQIPSVPQNKSKGEDQKGANSSIKNLPKNKPSLSLAQAIQGLHNRINDSKQDEVPEQTPAKEIIQDQFEVSQNENEQFVGKMNSLFVLNQGNFFNFNNNIGGNSTSLQYNRNLGFNKLQILSQYLISREQEINQNSNQEGKKNTVIVAMSNDIGAQLRMKKYLHSVQEKDSDSWEKKSETISQNRYHDAISNHSNQFKQKVVLRQNQEKPQEMKSKFNNQKSISSYSPTSPNNQSSSLIQEFYLISQSNQKASKSINRKESLSQIALERSEINCLNPSQIQQNLINNRTHANIQSISQIQIKSVNSP